VQSTKKKNLQKAVKKADDWKKEGGEMTKEGGLKETGSVHHSKSR